mmetsp:Transcript_17644/g.36886  ORF Transcript_17644/g.36886 Transcript_17644/m.36886 type:complete len:287 (+) Transcript_17644:173-1033(+)
MKWQQKQMCLNSVVYTAKTLTHTQSLYFLDSISCKPCPRNTLHLMLFPSLLIPSPITIIIVILFLLLFLLLGFLSSGLFRVHDVFFRRRLHRRESVVVGQINVIVQSLLPGIIIAALSLLFPTATFLFWLCYLLCCIFLGIVGTVCIFGIVRHRRWFHIVVGTALPSLFLPATFLPLPTVIHLCIILTCLPTTTTCIAIRRIHNTPFLLLLLLIRFDHLSKPLPLLRPRHVLLLLPVRGHLLQTHELFQRRILREQNLLRREPVIVTLDGSILESRGHVPNDVLVV